jgi:hypothetical protein
VLTRDSFRDSSPCEEAKGKRSALVSFSELPVWQHYRKTRTSLSTS